MDFQLFRQVGQVQSYDKRTNNGKHKCMFNIQLKYKRKIEKLSMLPVTFNASKSLVVETAIDHFSKLSKQKQIELMFNAKGGK